MRSTEMSGAGASRFCATDSKRAKRAASLLHVLPSLRDFFSPVSLAVATTAFLSAGIFVTYDLFQTYSTAQFPASIAADTVSQDTPLSPVSMARALVDSSFSGAAFSARAGMVSEASLVAPQTNETAMGKTDLFQPALQNDEERLAAVFGRGAAAFGLAGLFTLVAARRRSERDLKSAGHSLNYSQLASAIPMGLACWTSAGRLIVCNDSYRERLELDEEEANYHEAVSRLAAGGYMKLVRDDDSNRILELHRQDGSCLMIDERPLGDGCFMTLVSDVTEHKRTSAMLDTIRVEQRMLARRYHEEKLKAEAASRAKTNFLAHLSHDIRTPLNHIIGFAELMKHETYGPLGDARYSEYIQSIKTSGEHLLESFGTILDLAELESGQKALR